jgi:putative transposase
VDLCAEEQRELEALVRAHHTAQQIALRARIVLEAAQGHNNAEIARHIGVDVDTVRLWRTRWLELRAVGLEVEDLGIKERLSDAPRPGAPAHISAEQVCRVMELACTAPEETGRPITQWSAREIADEIIKRGIIAHISPRHAARLLKRGTSNPISSGTG